MLWIRIWIPVKNTWKPSSYCLQQRYSSFIDIYDLSRWRILESLPCLIVHRMIWIDWIRMWKRDSNSQSVQFRSDYFYFRFNTDLFNRTADATNIFAGIRGLCTSIWLRVTWILAAIQLKSTLYLKMAKLPPSTNSYRLRGKFPSFLCQFSVIDMEARRHSKVKFSPTKTFLSVGLRMNFGNSETNLIKSKTNTFPECLP